MKAFTAKKKLLAAALATTLGVVSSDALAVVFNDFTVDPSTYSNKTTFTADKITGNYVEVASFVPTGPGGGTFDVSIQWSAGQFVANDGVTALPGSTTGLGDSLGYGMYGLFQASGTFVTVGGVSTFTFSPGGSLNLWIDDAGDTTFTAPGSGAAAWTTGSAADDVLIATGAMVSGVGVLDPTLATCVGGGINCGSFGTTTSFVLEDPEGKDFFILPDPFYKFAFESGQFNNFDPTSQLPQTINGSLDAVFIPEPATLALMGIGLIGLGGMRRKKA